MTKDRLEAAQSNQWANLQAFGEQVLQPRREALGLSQPQMGKKIGVDQSRISRVERGRKPKDAPTAQRYIDAYQLSQGEANCWLELIFGHPPTSLFPPEDLALVDGLIDSVRNIRIQGNPTQAINIVEQLDRWVLEKGRHASAAQYSQIQATHGWLLLEKANTYRDFLAGQEILKAALPILKEVAQIATACANEEMLGRVGRQFGSLCYITEDYPSAIQHYQACIGLLKTPEERLVVLSGLAISLGYSGKVKEVGKVAAKFNQLLDETECSDLPTVCDALQTVARAQGLVKLDDAWKTLDQLQAFCLKKNLVGQLAPIRDVQLYKAQVEVIVQFEPWRKADLEILGQRGLTLAQTYGFHRHSKQIGKILEDSLN